MQSKTRFLTSTAMGAVLLALCAWVTVPAPVPFTLQTFGIFLLLNALGGRLGTASIGLYLFLGLVGLPVFAGFKGGPAALVGPTGGYILGFLLTGLIYWLAERFTPAKSPFRIAACAVGLAACYGFGSAWFLLVAAKGGTVYTMGGVLGLCVVPFILPDCVKLGLAVAVSRRLPALGLERPNR